MKLKTLNKALYTAIVAAVFSTAALADHNGMHGAGWAGMPNDIHNTVVEDDLSGTEFRDFVARGAGADSINRYTDDDTNGNSRSPSNGGSSNAGGNGRGGRS